MHNRVLVLIKNDSSERPCKSPPFLSDCLRHILNSCYQLKVSHSDKRAAPTIFAPLCLVRLQLTQSNDRTAGAAFPGLGGIDRRLGGLFESANGKTRTGKRCSDVEVGTGPIRMTCGGGYARKRPVHCQGEPETPSEVGESCLGCARRVCRGLGRGE